MNKEDSKCYKDRYTDVNNNIPVDHFKRIGKSQGRLSTCSMELTDI